MKGAICAIDDNSWLVGSKLLVSHETTGPTEGENRISSMEEGDTVSYTFRELSDDEPVPQTQPDKPVPFPMVYSAGSHGAWKIGDAYLKAAHIYPRDIKVTREHVTLNAINYLGVQLGVEIPRVLYHGEWDDKRFIIVNAMKGQILARVWKTMDDNQKTDCTRQVANFVKALSSQEADYIGGVDGGYLFDHFLSASNDDNDLEAFNHERLKQNCKDAGMDVDRPFVLQHCDLGPLNVLYDVNTRKASVIDFEIAGYAPREWIRTSFDCRLAMAFECEDIGAEDPNDEKRFEWQLGVSRDLEEMGFETARDSWIAWVTTKKEGQKE
ncbi:hypothetical protein K470DRAFT_215586 [Piedraia hortae CBS 480.64]|uniref:Aminoglycoside phosphotransferase domain-containing protein n=1 Tax=Piedraia hortae CBS 480.64 TaxID=1314780 RepID=A0A6A7C141_9PEZI|nr:hypothetical protein K470DRAFT_215586 [Piedraia hortae CBS 480.64]